MLLTISILLLSLHREVTEIIKRIYRERCKGKIFITNKFNSLTNMAKKLINYELEPISIPKGLRKRIAVLMAISEKSVSNIANCHTTSMLQRDRLKRAIEIASKESIDKIGEL